MKRGWSSLSRGLLVLAAFSVGCAGASPRPLAAAPRPLSLAPLAPLAQPSLAKAASPAEPTVAEVVDRALPAVVLLLNNRADGSTVYGAGLIVGRDGRVLTNQHVIADAKSLGAMLYKPGRVSYTPMDGGLGRYIFENQKD